MEENKIDVIAKAKELLLQSPVMKYGITEERIEEAFSKAHMMPTQEALLKEWSPIIKYDGRLDGFNRNHHCYFGPEATPHIVIHEMIHELFSEFDQDGHRVVNGIAKDNSYSQVQLNEGITDYIASKISGENVLHYEREKIVFERIEPLLIKQSGNPEVLFEILSQDKNRINDFVEEFAKPETANKVVNDFQFMNKEKINLAMDEIEKRFNRHHKFEQFKARISSIFHKRKALPPGKNNEKQELSSKKNKVKEFKEEYECEVLYEKNSVHEEEGIEKILVKEDDEQEL